MFPHQNNNPLLAILVDNVAQVLPTMIKEAVPQLLRVFNEIRVERGIAVLHKCEAIRAGNTKHLTKKRRQQLKRMSDYLFEAIDETILTDLEPQRKRRKQTTTHSTDNNNEDSNDDNDDNNNNNPLQLPDNTDGDVLPPPPTLSSFFPVNNNTDTDTTTTMVPLEDKVTAQHPESSAVKQTTDRK